MRRAHLVALALSAAMVAVVVACSESQAPLGNGDDVISDVDASDAQAPSQSEDAAEDYDAATFAPVDGEYTAAPDGYAPYTLCQKCGCPAGSFCFGGGTGYTSFNGDCHADGGPLADAGLSLGCFPIPASCKDVDAACDCLIQAVSAYVTGCYADCTVAPNVVSCPNP
jgi:hypothetical protein